MSKKRLSLLVQMMSNYSQLSEADRVHFADFIRSQQPPRAASKKASKGSSKRAQSQQPPAAPANDAEGE